MEKDSATRYRPPVDNLLTYGESEQIIPDEWPDYRALGIEGEHIPGSKRVEQKQNRLLFLWETCKDLSR